MARRANYFDSHTIAMEIFNYITNYVFNMFQTKILCILERLEISGIILNSITKLSYMHHSLKHIVSKIFLILHVYQCLSHEYSYTIKKKCSNLDSFFQNRSLSCHLRIKPNFYIIGASLSEPHIDGTAGRFHILWYVWYDRHPRAAVGRTKYVGLP